MNSTTFLENNRVLQHCFQYQHLYLPLLALVVLAIPLLLNVLQGEPLLQGGESYYHLSQARDLSLPTWYYYPLHLLLSLKGALVLLSLLAGIASVWLFLNLAKLLGWEQRFTFFLSLLVILSPAFIWTFSTLSTYAAVLFLALLGLLLFLHPRQTLWAILPWGLVSFLEGFSALLLILLGLFIWNTHREQKRAAVLITLSALFFLTIVLLHQPFFLGPFYAENHFSGLIADFGARGGISFFALLLGLIGLGLVWKENKLAPVYAFVPILIAGYAFNTHTGFYLTLLAAVTGIFGLDSIFNRPWTFPTLKKFTLFLLLLGILFSTISYLDRISVIGPHTAEKNTLLWMNENTPKESLVLALPEESNYVRYFAQRTPFCCGGGTSGQREKQAVRNKMLSSVYIHELFPLLEEHQINLIYITPEWRRMLPAEQGFLFLLKNERFKLLYAEEGYEVWKYELGGGKLSQQKP